MIKWLAGPDGIAHAQYPRMHFTLCKRRATLERWAWPTKSVCKECLRAATNAS